MATQMYSIEVVGSQEVPGEGKPRRSILCPDKLVQSYPSNKGNTNITTLYENFLEGVQRSGMGHATKLFFQPLSIHSGRSIDLVLFCIQ
jgi:long-chain acyl-CoA synthetase